MYLFLKQAILNFKQTGALFKSSKFLSKKISSFIPYNNSDKIIVELGPGNGVITKEILKSISKNSTLIVFELNDVFCEELKKIDDNRLVVLNENATKLDDFSFLKNVDCIISSLPLASIKNEIKIEIFEKINKTLVKNGLFIQYQYSLLDYSFLKKKFNHIKLKFVLLNIPPSFIYVCEK